MKRLVLFLLLCVGFTFALGEGPKADQKMNEGVISGQILLPEISGPISVGNRLLVAADDPEAKNKPYHMTALLEHAIARLESKQVRSSGDRIHNSNHKMHRINRLF